MCILLKCHVYHFVRFPTNNQFFCVFNFRFERHLIANRIFDVHRNQHLIQFVPLESVLKTILLKVSENVRNSDRLIWSAAWYWWLYCGCFNVLYFMDEALMINKTLSHWHWCTLVTVHWKGTGILHCYFWFDAFSMYEFVILGGRFDTCANIFQIVNWIETYNMFIRRPLFFVYYSHLLMLQFDAYVLLPFFGHFLKIKKNIYWHIDNNMKEENKKWPAT